jgi:SAM-dependent methyltransferase
MTAGMTARVPERIRWAVEQLAVRAPDHVLEIGCGSGLAVALLGPRLSRGAITAIDRSALQVARARALNEASIATGRARIESLSLTEAPAAFPEGFDKILAINVNAFWTDPAPSVASLCALLRPGGRACLVYEPPSAAALRDLRASLPALLQAHGLVVEDVRLGASGSRRLLAVVSGACSGARRGIERSSR